MPPSKVNAHITKFKKKRKDHLRLHTRTNAEN